MSYHLRLLAGSGFVREVAGRGQGRDHSRRTADKDDDPTGVGVDVKVGRVTVFQMALRLASTRPAASYVRPHEPLVTGTA